MLGDPWWLKGWIENNVPKADKISRDAVEILMRQLLVEAERQRLSKIAADERERRYGPEYP